MTFYRKKPVVIEAVQWFPNVKHEGVKYHYAQGKYKIAYVTTIHNQEAYLEPGDWILPEPKEGHFYPCKPDIFESTYEKVEEMNT